MSRTYALLENDDEWREAVDNIQIELQKIHAGLKKVEDLNRANLKCQWGPSPSIRRPFTRLDRRFFDKIYLCIPSQYIAYDIDLY